MNNQIEWLGMLTKWANEMKPLFIPLKAEFFWAFKAGTKTTEYRLYGPRWNERTCPVGRPVTLALGYGKTRIHGQIADFSINTRAQEIPGWKTCYGDNKGPAACIVIDIQPS